MRSPAPRLYHPPAVYEAIVAEHEGRPERLGARLQQLGWSLADAAWATVNWPPLWLAAAVAAEREKRGLSLTPPPPPAPNHSKKL